VVLKTATIMFTTVITVPLALVVTKLCHTDA
jgi:hypothetical protein